MIALFKHKWNRVAVRFAGISFIVGTSLMLIALIAEDGIVITLGISFLVLYILATLVMLLILFVITMANFKDIHEHVMTLIIVLMNFPIAILYMHFLNF